MYKNFDTHKPYFYSVALCFILLGAAVTAVGVVEWSLNEWWNYQFAFPLLKFIGGLVVLALGYIHLELELLRIQGRNRSN